MKNKIGVFLTGIILLMTFSCNIKNVEKYNEDFKGEWKTKVYYSPTKGDSIRNFLNVEGKESAFGVACEEDVAFKNCLIFQTGKIKFNTSTKAMQFGNSVSQIHYVTEEPFINENGEWELSLDSISYFKY
ncbi:hypothetical protein [Brumimicrobium mesophilum]|uniref:hypothetical protein n=1 Tax=Brumimicrobium mesophilum TaxID=392717 RepID=UPI000D13F933|nr:hypothetical protein [Brumimicrobium mesophilum]